MKAMTKINLLRSFTGAGYMDCKNALIDSNGDIDLAMDVLRRTGHKLVDRTKLIKSEGKCCVDISDDRKIGKSYIKNGDDISNINTIEAPYVAHYIHNNGTIATMVGLSEVNQEVGKNIAMQISAIIPMYIDKDSFPKEVLTKEYNKLREELSNTKKDLIDRIIEGKLNKFIKENSLLTQKYIKDEKTIEEYLKENNIKIINFSRISLI